MPMPNRPPKGFYDVFDDEAWLENIVSQTLTNLHYMHGYKLLKLPIIERKSSFSKEVVGSSPWPEWNAKNCIPVAIDDYNSGYVKVGTLDGLLIPEGTVSVARWLSTLVEDQEDVLPLKIMYNCPCFRNESIESLIDGHKLRQFDQFGMEILGSSSFHADVETMMLIVEGLNYLGVSKGDILVRLGDVRLFSLLAVTTGLGESDTIRAKELLDRIAETRAKGDDVRGFIEQIHQLVGHEHLDSKLRTAWDDLITTSGHYSSVKNISSVLPEEQVTYLKRLSQVLEGLGIQSIIDLAVVRSHEYYTSVVMEVDVSTDNYNVIEIAGGGRYDRLISPFTADDHPPIPAIGYAYGLQRVCTLFKQSCGDAEIDLTMCLRPTDRLLIHRTVDPVSDYTRVSSFIASGKQALVYLGDDLMREERYAALNGFKIVR